MTRSNINVLLGTAVETDQLCYHCHQPCEEILWLDEKAFCCHGCKTVFEILSANDLCEYYVLDGKAGNNLKNVDSESFRYLDEVDIRKKVIEFDSDNFAKVKFFAPGIHCISCIWLLENLQKLNKGILRSQVNFTQKTVTIEFDPRRIPLGTVASTMASVGYPPQINLDAEPSAKPRIDKQLVLKLALAGFCFGNVMLFSFPEYLGLDHSDKNLMRIFSWLNLTLSIPVFFYSGFDYMRSAVRSFKLKQINIDVPIAIGLLALFLRSSYDIITATGAGYLDSFTGLVFFLLIGRWFQSKTYESLAFDRDFKSYFPLAVSRLTKDEWKPAIIYDLKKGDHVRIRNMEIVPADSTLLDSKAWIDYSFVTGEARPTKVERGGLIYAGGRLVGTPVTLLVEQKTSQSHLTSLWNNDAFKKVTESKYQKTIDRAARIFTWVVMFIAVATFVYWQMTKPESVWLVITSVLMVACPCALALAAPFTFGNMLRVFGNNSLYLKNADIIEKMADIDTVVFDKTGTVTHGQAPEVEVTGVLDDDQLRQVKTLTSFSTHPLSVLICKSIPAHNISYAVTNFKELPGKGIQAEIDDACIKLGSADFVGATNQLKAGSSVFVSFDDEICGYFSIKSTVRPGLGNMLEKLSNKKIHLISGDNDTDSQTMREIFPKGTEIRFNQSPHDKLEYIENLQRNGAKVLMIGDGLNDAGALKQSDVGLAITDDTGVFTPACDGILLGEKLPTLHKLLKLASTSTVILKSAFAISFFYNAIALSFAVSGNLTPLVAAILMPISSISVVGFSTLAVNYSAKRKLRTKNQSI